MSTAENKEVVRRYFDERWNHKNLAVCDELLAPSSFDIEGHKAWMQSMYETLGSIELTILDMLAEDEQVAVHWRLAGTHQSDYLGVPTTNKRITIQGMALLRVRDGKIVEDQAYSDTLALQRELEGTSTLAQA